MKKTGKPVAPDWLMLTFLGIFMLGVFLVFLVLASPLLVVTLIAKLLNVKAIYKSLRNQW